MISIRLAAYRRRSRIGAIRIAASTNLATIAAMPAAAQSVLAYPARGQSQEQQDRDRSNATSGPCSRRVQLPDQRYSPTGPPPPSWNRRAPQAAKGGAFGAVGGAIAGDAGKGAATGAGVGGLFAVMRRREMEMQQAQAQSRQAAAAAQRNAGFNRAMTACLLSGSSFLCCGDRAWQDAGSQTGGKREPGYRFVAFRAAVPRDGHSARGNPQPSFGLVTEGEQRRRRSLCLSQRTSTPRIEGRRWQTIFVICSTSSAPFEL